MSTENVSSSSSTTVKVIDSHLCVWETPIETFFGEPTLRGDVEFLLQYMEEAGIDGGLIVQPDFQKFDHSYVTSVIKKYPGKFGGCCLANPAEDGSGIKQLEDLVTKDGYCAVRFDPSLWPEVLPEDPFNPIPFQKTTNAIGKALFKKAGELGIPVTFNCNYPGLHKLYPEIVELCTQYPSTTLVLDHMGSCKAESLTDEELIANENLLDLARFPQVYLKLIYPYKDVSALLTRAISKYGANRIMWGSEFPYVLVIPNRQHGYGEAKAAISEIAKEAKLSSSDLDLILGGTIMKVFSGRWASS